MRYGSKVFKRNTNKEGLVGDSIVYRSIRRGIVGFGFEG